MENLLKEVCRISEKYINREFLSGEYYNIFQVIDMTSNETGVHSAFIADLLNPKGRHRMGDVFLKLFLEMDIFKDMNFESANAIVEREKYIGEVTDETGGRIDIHIMDSSGKCIIIENKIYAAVSDRRAAMIRYERELLGPMKKEEVDRATKAFLNRLRRAQLTGEIQIFDPNENYV